jgi:hypothetical protein
MQCDFAIGADKCCLESLETAEHLGMDLKVVKFFNGCRLELRASGAQVSGDLLAHASHLSIKSRRLTPPGASAFIAPALGRD